MKRPICSKATLGRLPLYLTYLRTAEIGETVSASHISKSLSLGEVLVRKDLNAVCGNGKPKIGYHTDALLKKLESILGEHHTLPAVIVGAGKLGSALLGFEGFDAYGLKIIAAFDSRIEQRDSAVYPMEQFTHFCMMQDVHIGIITVPVNSAQEICDLMVRSGITAIWNFAPCVLQVPKSVIVQQENLALSLAHLTLSVRGATINQEE
ncbi:MAG: redox-sensing transcriptional repressor Rex [Oscillospiraceae bacterium]|nr:redox-sensing transcriptional repressor Rex [Oscillospiraceae bacterium]